MAATLFLLEFGMATAPYSNLDASAMLLGSVVLASCILFGLGIRPAITGVAFSVGGLYLNLKWGWYDGRQPFIQHHLFLLCVAALSLALSRGNELLTMRNLRILVLATYAYAIISKLNGDYLSGFRLLQTVILFYGSFLPEPLMLWRVLQICSLAALAAEVMIVALLLSPRHRTWGVRVGVVFHGVIQVLLPVGGFSLFMIALLLFCFAPQTDIPKEQGTLN